MSLDRRVLPSDARVGTWTAPDGWQIRRFDWAPPQDRPPRGNLLFAGGRADFIEKYLEPLAHWRERGWHVTSFDWRGQGQSRGDIRGGNFRDFDPLVADSAAFLQTWVGERQGPHVAICHSMGGHILLRVLAEHQPALDAAVLVAPMLGFNAGKTPPWAGRAAAALMARVAPNLLLWREGGPANPSGPIRQKFLTHCQERFADELWWKEQEPGFHLGPTSWGWIDAAFRSMARHTPEALRRVKVPVLLLGAERDRLVSGPHIRRAESLLPEAELLMFSNAAHELLREEDAVRLQALARIDTFLDQHAFV